MNETARYFMKNSREDFRRNITKEITLLRKRRVFFRKSKMEAS